MPYEHKFADLHSDQGDPEPSVVDLGPDPSAAQVDPTGRINKAPGNPDAGKTDQFDDLRSSKKQGGADTVDDGIDVDLADTGQDNGNDTDVVPTGDDSDDDLRGLSQGVRERIQRERLLRQEAEEKSRRVEADLASLNRKVDLQGKETEWRTADEKDDATLTDLKSRKAKAVEEGNTALQIELDDKISDVKADKRSREKERTDAREAAKKPAPPPPNPRAQAWLAKHPQYNTDPLFKEAANAADRLLYTQGFSANTDEFYVRLTRILNEGGKFTVDQSYLKGKTPTRGGARGMGSNGVRQGNSGDVKRGQGGRMTVTITPADKALLASMGQDPDDPVVQKAFAREKLAANKADEAARRDR